MKNKIILIISTLALTVILFSISTYTQKKLINYEPKVKCLFVKEDINANEKISEDMFYIDDIDVSLIASIKIVQKYSEIDGLYARDNILKGQIVISKQFDTKENLSIYEVENGKEKVSIKIKSSENGVSYSIKNDSLINVYATLRADMAQNFLNDKEKLIVGTAEDGYVVIKLLKNITVLELFDLEGNRISESDTNIIDTVLIAVTDEEAKEINLLREICTFNISSVGKKDAQN